MATQNKLSFFETVEKFKNGEELNLKEIIQEKTISELLVVLDGVTLQLDLLSTKKLDEVQYEIQKQYIKFFYGLLQCTSLEIKDEDYNVDNIDFGFEELIYRNSVTVRKLYKMIENMIYKRELSIINDLTNEFKNLPSIEEINELKDGIDGIFRDKSEGELSMIESILAYNDPNMKMLKDIVTAPVIENKQEKVAEDNGNNITKGEKV